MTTPEIYRLETPSVSLDEILRYMGCKAGGGTSPYTGERGAGRDPKRSGMPRLLNTSTAFRCRRRDRRRFAYAAQRRSSEKFKRMHGGFCICRYHWACRRSRNCQSIPSLSCKSARARRGGGRPDRSRMRHGLRHACVPRKSLSSSAFFPRLR